MEDKLKKKELTKSEMAHLAYQTCQWWNAVFVQAERFMDAEKNNNGEFPWDEDGIDKIFLAERLFLVTAIHHAIERMEKLNIELQRTNVSSFQSTIDAIETVASLRDIQSWRSMIEHGLEYMAGVGHKQDRYKTVLSIGDYKIETTAAVTFILGEEKKFFVGKIDIIQLLNVMKQQLPVVKEATKTVFEKNFV